jgi:predicted outer membrane repeat protein
MRVLEIGTRPSVIRQFQAALVPFAVALLVLASACQATTYVVRPDGTGDFPTIQEAIEAAVDGDIVELTDGTFSGGGEGQNVNFLGKSITLRSQSGNAALCIILREDIDAPVVKFSSGETESTVLERVTIQGAYLMGAGGGISCRYGSSPTIRGCIIRGNRAVFGAGIYCGEAASPVIVGCTISDNTAGIPPYPGSGGAICLDRGPSVTIIDCLLSENEAGGSGGAIHCYQTNLVAVDCRVLGNILGALYCASSTVEISNCEITGNSGHEGTALRCLGSSITIAGSTISGNDSWYTAGGIEVREDSAIRLDRCVLWGNCAAEGHHEIHVDASSSAEFICSIVDSAGVWAEGEIAGLGPESFVDPQFCDPAPCEDAPTAEGDYTVADSSPCTPENSPCGDQIGALPVGCSASSVLPTTWGRLKKAFQVE